jgi:hypothetical protein
LVELGAEEAEVALDPFGAADHHVVRAGKSLRLDNLSGKRPEAALHSVANDCATDFLRDGEADAHRAVRILPVADEQDEAGSRRAEPGVRRQEVGALGNGG